MAVTRPAAVAGMFYPGNAAECESVMAACLAPAEAAQAGKPVPKAIIAPHAGWVYSGPIAAQVYARLEPARGRITRVVLLGPSHRVAFHGLALAGADSFATPLGAVAVDKTAQQVLAPLPQVGLLDQAHAQEHSLEVHLPFLQRVLGDFVLVPLVVGEASPSDVAEVLEALWGGPETLIVISSDLSHYLDYDSARALDAQTAAAILNLNPDAIAWEQACGRVPVGGLLEVARRRGLSVEMVDMRNSGDTAGDRRQVVGYGAWAFTDG